MQNNNEKDVPKANYVKVNMALSKKVKSMGRRRANKLFAGNLSAYVSHLIIRDCAHTETLSKTDR